MDLRVLQVPGQRFSGSSWPVCSQLAPLGLYDVRQKGICPSFVGIKDDTRLVSPQLFQYAQHYALDGVDVGNAVEHARAVSAHSCAAIARRGRISAAVVPRPIAIARR